jgi:hypothetical protein
LRYKIFVIDLQELSTVGFHSEYTTRKTDLDVCQFGIWAVGYNSVFQFQYCGPACRQPHFGETVGVLLQHPTEYFARGSSIQGRTFRRGCMVHMSDTAEGIHQADELVRIKFEHIP